MADPLAVVHADAARLGYVDARTGSLPEGLSAKRLRRHLRRIGWSPWVAGFWVPADPPPFLVRCRIALAAVGPEAVLTGASALWAYGVLDDEPADVELLMPATRWVRAPAKVHVRHTTDTEALRSSSPQGLRCAWAARAIADYAGEASQTCLCRATANAVRLRRCTLAQVGAELARRERFPGRGRLRAAVDELGEELNHSGSERLGRGLLRAAGVAVPSRPGPVLRGDRPVAEIDLPFYDVCYGVEIDGPPHLLPDQAARDAARDRMLGRDCDWTIDRFFWFELEEHPERFVREVVTRLRALGSVAAPPP